jgi:hypothetical protein
MLFSLKSLSCALALMPLVVANVQGIEMRGTMPQFLVVLRHNNNTQTTADNTVRARVDSSPYLLEQHLFLTLFEVVDPVIMINPTDANFGISAVAPGRFVTSADRTKIFSEARGDPLKPAIVFIHGFGLGAIAFNEIFDDPLWLLQVYMVNEPHF